MRKVVVLGSTNTDMVISGKKIPVPGETISGGTFLMNPGGKGGDASGRAGVGAVSQGTRLNKEA